MDNYTTVLNDLKIVEHQTQNSLNELANTALQDAISRLVNHVNDNEALLKDLQVVENQTQNNLNELANTALQNAISRVDVKEV